MQHPRAAEERRRQKRERIAVDFVADVGQVVVDIGPERRAGGRRFSAPDVTMLSLQDLRRQTDGNSHRPHIEFGSGAGDIAYPVIRHAVV